MIPLDAASGNRWAAFTDDELDDLSGGLHDWIDDPLLVLDEWAKPRLLLNEILAERELRRCCKVGMHAYPNPRTMESDELCLHCAKRRPA